jgi:hypothetical protein
VAEIKMGEWDNGYYRDLKIMDLRLWWNDGRDYYVPTGDKRWERRSLGLLSSVGLGQFSSLIRDKNEVSKFIDANVQKKILSNLTSTVSLT